VRVVSSPFARAAKTCRLVGLGEPAQHRRARVQWDSDAREPPGALAARGAAVPQAEPTLAGCV
jgi:hypothetical protein